MTGVHIEKRNLDRARQGQRDENGKIQGEHD